MKTENKILVGGLVLAALVFGAGFWIEHRAEKRLALLVGECEATNAAKRTSPARSEAHKPITAEDVLDVPPPPHGFVPDDPQAVAGPWVKYKNDPLVCAPFELYSLTEATGIQKEIRDSYFDSLGAHEITAPAAMALGVLSVIPWLWYFLLRRIVELRNAIGGKAP
jgi:hypothetical protein